MNRLEGDIKIIFKVELVDNHFPVTLRFPEVYTKGTIRIGTDKEVDLPIGLLSALLKECWLQSSNLSIQHYNAYVPDAFVKAIQQESKEFVEKVFGVQVILPVNPTNN